MAVLPPPLPAAAAVAAAPTIGSAAATTPVNDWFRAYTELQTNPMRPPRSMPSTMREEQGGAYLPKENLGSMTQRQQ